jgi:hypothetical protein
VDSGAETLARRAELADAGEAEPAAAGLPVVPEFTDPASARIRHQLDDESGGGVRRLRPGRD